MFILKTTGATGGIFDNKVNLSRLHLPFNTDHNIWTSMSIRRLTKKQTLEATINCMFIGASIIITAVVIVANNEWTTGRIIFLSCFFGISFALMPLVAEPKNYLSKDYEWPFRFATHLVFIFYLAYMIDQLWFPSPDVPFMRRWPGASPINSILGFIMLGLPCLSYTLFGTFHVTEGLDRSHTVHSFSAGSLYLGIVAVAFLFCVFSVIRSW